MDRLPVNTISKGLCLHISRQSPDLIALGALTKHFYESGLERVWVLTE